VTISQAVLWKWLLFLTHSVEQTGLLSPVAKTYPVSRLIRYQILCLFHILSKAVRRCMTHSCHKYNLLFKHTNKYREKHLHESTFCQGKRTVHRNLFIIIIIIIIKLPRRPLRWLSGAVQYMHAMYITRNSSGDEIANVNFIYHDIVHALKIQ